MLNIFTKALTNQNPKNGIKPEHIWKAVESVYKRAHGAYSVISYIAKQGMVAFRDPYGIRPMLFGKRQNGLTTEYIFASESVTLDILGFEFIDDIKPGEAVFIEESTRKLYRKKIANKPHIPCIFEYVYFARPDSIMDKISVYKARLRMGRKLAQKIKAAKLDIDVVVPVRILPEQRLSKLRKFWELNIARDWLKIDISAGTFIMAGQAVQKSIRYKLNTMPLEIKGQNVLLVDDSIVRRILQGKSCRWLKIPARKSLFCVILSACYHPLFVRH